MPTEKPVQTTNQKVLAAAAACPTAKETLKTLFPDVFKDSELYDSEGRLLFGKPGKDGTIYDGKGEPLIQARAAGYPLSGASLWLNPKYTWQFLPVPVNIQLLLAYRK